MDIRRAPVSLKFVSAILGFANEQSVHIWDMGEGCSSLSNGPR